MPLPRFRRHSGHGRTCCWLDPVANDPLRTSARSNISRCCVERVTAPPALGACRKSGVLSDALRSAPDAVTDVADCDPNKPNRRADATQHHRFFEPLPIRQRRFRFGVFRHGF